MLAAREPSGFTVRTSENRAAIRLRSSVDVGALEDLAHERAPGREQPLGPRQRLAEQSPPSAPDRSRACRSCSGAMSDSTMSNAASVPSSSASGVVKMSPLQDARARDRVRQRVPVDADHGAVRADHLERVLQPRARPAAEVEHAIACAHQPQAAIDLLELVDGARRETGSSAPS